MSSPNFNKVKSSNGKSHPCFTRSQVPRLLCIVCSNAPSVLLTVCIMTATYSLSSEMLSMVVVFSEEKFVSVSGRLISRIKSPPPGPYKTLHFLMHTYQYDLISHNFCLPSRERNFQNTSVPF